MNLLGEALEHTHYSFTIDDINASSLIIETKDSRCIHCGYGKKIQYKFKLKNSDKVYKIDHWGGCLTYSEYWKVNEDASEDDTDNDASDFEDEF